MWTTPSHGNIVRLYILCIILPILSLEGEFTPYKKYIFCPWPVMLFIHLDLFEVCCRVLEISVKEMSAFSNISTPQHVMLTAPEKYI